ncbi:MAG: carbohydrate kinase family protein [Candidatus Woesearchaeota archaeon]
MRWGATTSYDIITIGSATVDVFANTASELVKFITPNGENDFITYPSGSKILISQLDFLIGGGGTNTAASFSRLGLETAFLGKLGDDENAIKVLSMLDSEGIDFVGARGGQTGYSIILDSIEHDRTILTFKGANNDLRIEDLELEDTLETKWLYASSMVEESFETMTAIFDNAHESGVHIAFNPSSYQAKQGVGELSEVLEKCTVMVMNHEEAQLLLDKKAPAKELAVELQQHPEQYIIITQGPEGATCFHKDTLYHLNCTPHLNVVETTGAGDAFASGFVAGLIKELPVKDALKLGMVQAESVILSRGAKRRLLTWPEAKKRLANFKGQLHKNKVTDKQAHKIKGIEKEYVPPGFEHHVHGKKRFKLADKRMIASLDELARTIPEMNDEVFFTHVGDGYNHFADWIRDVFGLEMLSKTLRKTTDKELTASILSMYKTYSQQ